jgi:hypothetical protein
MGNYKLQLRADGLSIEEVRLISGAERNNGKQRGIFSEASGTTTDMDTSSYYYSSNRTDYYIIILRMPVCICK